MIIGLIGLISYICAILVALMSTHLGWAEDSVKSVKVRWRMAMGIVLMTAFNFLWNIIGGHFSIILLVCYSVIIPIWFLKAQAYYEEMKK